jgi:hypothetical protein
MEIGKLDCGAWLVLQPVNEKIGEIRLKILPKPVDFLWPEQADIKTAAGFIARLIAGWNLETDGVAVPCNDETKAKYLPNLIIVEVQAADGKEPELLMVPIGRFAADINNFLGN